MALALDARRARPRLPRRARSWPSASRRRFATLDRLERHEGHLLNWYDTRTLAPLLPRYVSTVDSGNLAGVLVALAQGLQRPGATAARTSRHWPGLARHGGSLLSAALEAAPRDARRCRTAAATGCASVVRQVHEARAGRRRGAPPRAAREPAPRRCAGRRRRRRRGTRRARGGAARRGARLARNIDALLADPTARRTPSCARGCSRSPRAPRRSSRRWTSASSTTAQRKLFAIGYRLADAEGPGRLDASSYDLLASEARLASFIAIAKERRAAGALVPARPAAHERRRRAGAALVERHDVRVPDAAAADAAATRARCSTAPAASRCGARSQYAASRERAVGHLRVGASRSSTARATTSTRPSACRAWA